MNIYEALKVFGLGQTETTQEQIKQAYKRLSMKYHPDRNPAGLEMMQMINQAYNALKAYNGEVLKDDTADYSDYCDELLEALNKIITFGLDIEICGTWVWVSGNTKEFKEQLKEAGFKWAKKKIMWYFRPESEKKRFYGKGKTMDEIRATHGSKKVNTNNRKIAAA